MKGEWEPRKKLMPVPWFLAGHLDGQKTGFPDHQCSLPHFKVQVYSTEYPHCPRDSVSSKL